MNVNGLRQADKRAGLVHWLRSLPSVIDIICLQETHCISVLEGQSWFRSTGLSCAVSPGSNHSSGVVMLFRPHISLLRSWPDQSGRHLLAEFRSSDTVFRVCSIYAPNHNPDRDCFFEDVVDSIDPTIPTLLCGDFNTVFDRTADRRGSCPLDTSHESTAGLVSLFSECSVVDVWRSLHPTDQCFTWTKPDGSIASRIDLIGCPSAWVPFVSSSDILPCPFSDHSAVTLTWSLPGSISRGPGLWKLNCSVLDYPDFISLFSSFWSSWQSRRQSFSSPLLWWDRGKARIKDLTINFCKQRSQARHLERDLLSKLASHLKCQIDNGATSPLPIYHSVLDRLKTLDLVAARGAQVRSRVKWVEEGESSSSFFYRLEKKCRADRAISAIRSADDTVVTSPDGLCAAFRAFYVDLFTPVPVDSAVQTELLSHVPVLSASNSATCEGPLSLEECFSALSGMARGKAPGCDGLPMEFFLKFWNLLGQDLVNVLNFSFQSGHLSRSQRRGIISLSFKKDDRLDPKNWRPISLLNVDYKIASRVIAGRLLKVIHHVVGPDQTCGVPGRLIGENVAFLQDVVDYCTSSGQPGLILSLDQEKAFDRVDWSFLHSVLTRTGFGPSFCNWVRLFYRGASSAVNVNGFISDSLPLARGVCQGCPLSPLLYVLVVEVLACNIRAHPVISGICLPGSATPLPVISAYADDTSLVLSSDRAIAACLEVYERGSGASLNLSKCQGLWPGAWNGRTDSPIPIAWSSVKIKVLGVFLGPGNLEESNWQPRIEAVEHVLNSWRQRSLSFKGRALVVNVLALARVWYVASLIHVPEWVIAEINKLIFNFFWNGKRDLVACKVVVQPTCSGGFGMVDVRSKISALHVQWVRRLVTSPSSWYLFLCHLCSVHFGVTPIAVLSAPFHFSPRSLPPFYAALLTAWRSCSGHFSTSSLGVGSGIAFQPALSFSARSVYRLLLFDLVSTPHCFWKFLLRFGPLYWPVTWRQLFFFSIDRPVIDLCWKVAHGVVYTAERLISFGLNVPAPCFCGHQLESLEHLFFDCPLAMSAWSWVQSLMYPVSPVCPQLLSRHVLFGFSSDELRAVPRFFVYLINVCKFFLWLSRNDFRFRNIRPSAIGVIKSAKSRVRFYLPIFGARFMSSPHRRFFVRQWGARGRFASFANDKVVVTL